jgi:hypothetical protein
MLISWGFIVALGLCLLTVVGVIGRLQWLKRQAALQKVEGVAYIKRLVAVLIKAQKGLNVIFHGC